MTNTFQVLEQEDEGNRAEEETNEEYKVERDFNVMKKAFLEVAETVLGKPRKKNNPWSSRKSWKLTDERQQLNANNSARGLKRLRGS